MFLLALQYGGNQYAWDSSVVIGLFCGAGVTSIVFVAWNWRVGEEAMIPTYLVRQRVMWTSCLVMTFNMVLVFLASYYLPIYFQTVKGDNPLKSGVDLLPSILAQMLFAVLSGFLGELSVEERLHSTILCCQCTKILQSGSLVTTYRGVSSARYSRRLVTVFSPRSQIRLQPASGLDTK